MVGWVLKGPKSAGLNRVNISPAGQGGDLSVLPWIQSDVEQGLHRQRGHLCSCGAAKQDVQE